MIIHLKSFPSLICVPFIEIKIDENQGKQMPFGRITEQKSTGLTMDGLLMEG